MYGPGHNGMQRPMCENNRKRDSQSRPHLLQVARAVLPSVAYVVYDWKNFTLQVGAGRTWKWVGAELMQGDTADV